MADASGLSALREEPRDGKIVLGVCAMTKKASSKPMQTILGRIESTGKFTIKIFDEKVILESPIEEWPHPVDVLISFHSEGFPLDKAESYVALRKPHCINDLTAQRILLDRSKVYDLLAANDIPHPKAIPVIRDENGELTGAAATNFVEGDDFLKIGDKKIAKPFVEKPMDAEDHGVCIYYPSSSGGGRKRLFRKVDNRSSDFDPDVSVVRRDGSYLYEPFMQTQGTDIKVYTVGPHYAHAEARKSPAIDGVVLRNNDGKEIRYPVVLTPAEKEIARKICIAFEQFVCGFDLLRTGEGSFVIDVNGWSFVKGVAKYYQDCAAVLVSHMQHAVGRTPIARSVDDLLSKHRADSCASTDNLTKRKGPKPTDRWSQQELLAVLAVSRHGDRTPKNKTKFVTSRPGFLDLHKRWGGGPQKEAKLKSPKQLQAVLDLTDALLGRSGRGGECSRPAHSGQVVIGSDDDLDTDEQTDRTQREKPLEEKEYQACVLISEVLTKGGHFSGIYRKVQLKPVKWDANGAVEEVMLILKYGGILTPAGVAQAHHLGDLFRSEMYPGEKAHLKDGNGVHSDGLLRLHATQRHDFKVYSSDEGRVQMSAAAFVQGLLALERGALTPICTALVTTDSKMLDELPVGAEKLMQQAKKELHERIKEASAESPSPFSLDQAQDQEQECVTEQEQGAKARAAEMSASSSSEAMPVMEAMNTLAMCLAAVVKDLEGLSNENMAASVPCGTVADHTQPACCSTSKLVLVIARWKKLKDELWKSKTKEWDISKVPEIFDAVKFDLIHQPNLAPSFSALYDIAKSLNDIIVPNEYGYDLPSRVEIGSIVCGPLLAKLVQDLKVSRESKKVCEVRSEKKIVTAFQYLKRTFGLPDWLVSQQGKNPKAAEPANSEDDSTRKRKESIGGAEDECKEGEFAGLDAKKAVGLESPDRLVRTRLYFTSESHIQALMNVLRYCHHPLPESFKNEDGLPPRPPSQNSGSGSQNLANFSPSPRDVNRTLSKDTIGSLQKSSSAPSNTSGDSVAKQRSQLTMDGMGKRMSGKMESSDAASSSCSPQAAGIVREEQEAAMCAEPVFDYFTQIVFRLYEDKRVDASSDERYRVEVLFSPGARGHPSSGNANGHVMKVDALQPLHAPNEPLTLAKLLKLLNPMLQAGKGHKVSTEPYSPKLPAQTKW